MKPFVFTILCCSWPKRDDDLSQIMKHRKLCSKKKIRYPHQLQNLADQSPRNMTAGEPLFLLRRIPGLLASVQIEPRHYNFEMKFQNSWTFSFKFVVMIFKGGMPVSEVSSTAVLWPWDSPQTQNFQTQTQTQIEQKVCLCQSLSNCDCLLSIHCPSLCMKGPP